MTGLNLQGFKLSYPLGVGKAADDFLAFDS